MEAAGSLIQAKNQGFLLSDEHTQRRKNLLKTCLLGNFSKWVDSPEAVRNWAIEEWGVEDGKKNLSTGGHAISVSICERGAGH